MAAWFCPTLSADEQAAILADRDRHPDPVVRRKLLVLWAVHLGHSRQQAADLAAVGVATAKRYLTAYRDGGLDALRTREPGPRPAGWPTTPTPSRGLSPERPSAPSPRPPGASSN